MVLTSGQECIFGLIFSVHAHEFISAVRSKKIGIFYFIEPFITCILKF